jgi:hypothetical protein
MVSDDLRVKRQTKTRKLVTSFPFERVIANNLSDYALDIVQNELQKAMIYVCDGLQVHRNDNPNRRRLITDNDGHVNCSCGFPVSLGLPCRHLLKYFMQKQMQKIPGNIIAPRWLAPIESHDYVLSLQPVYKNSEPTEITDPVLSISNRERYNNLLSLFRNVAIRYSNTEMYCKLESLCNRLLSPGYVSELSDCICQIQEPHLIRDTEHVHENEVKDPVVIKRKGRPKKAKAKKGDFETVTETWSCWEDCNSYLHRVYGFEETVKLTSETHKHVSMLQALRKKIQHSGIGLWLSKLKK